MKWVRGLKQALRFLSKLGTVADSVNLHFETLKQNMSGGFTSKLAHVNPLNMKGISHVDTIANLMKRGVTILKYFIPYTM